MDIDTTKRKKRRVQFWKDKLSKVKRKKLDSKKGAVTLKTKKSASSGKKSKVNPSKDIPFAGSARGFRSKLNDTRATLSSQTEVTTIKTVTESSAQVSSSQKVEELRKVEAAADFYPGSDSSSVSSGGNESLSEGNGACKQSQLTMKRKLQKRRRYILFLGNLPVAASREDIVSHFRKRGVLVSEFRLLTHKDSGKSKGCGFMELESEATMHGALQLHRSKFQGKSINVEVTCGGGGKGERRKQKIQEKNRKLRLKKSSVNPVKHKTVSS